MIRKNTSNSPLPTAVNQHKEEHVHMNNYGDSRRPIEFRKLENDIRKASEIDETYATVPVHVAKAMLRIVCLIGEANKDMVAINHTFRLISNSKQSHKSMALDFLETECQELREKITNLHMLYPNTLHGDQAHRLATILRIYKVIYDV